MAMVAASAAKKAGDRVVDALKADLVTVGGQVFRRVEIGKGKKKETMLVPVDWTVHVNPVTIGTGLLALGGAAFFLIGEITVPGPTGPLTLYRGPLAEEWNAYKHRTKEIGAGIGSKLLGDKGAVTVDIRGFAPGSVGAALARAARFHIVGDKGLNVTKDATSPWKLPVDVYTVTPDPARFTWDPPSARVTVETAKVTIVSFTATSR